jgi:serine/threonine-protein kinase
MRASAVSQRARVSTSGDSGVRVRKPRVGGAAAKPAPPVTVPRMLGGRYRVLRPLGRGGMGEVWLAQDTKAEGPVAIKLAVSRDGHDPDVASCFAARFLFEADVARRVSERTTRVASVHGVVDQGDVSYLVMEAVRGRTLRTELDDCGRMTPARASLLVEQLAEALGAAHEAGYVHCDLKPGNVLLREAGSVFDLKLIDFGCAQAIAPSDETPPAPGGDLRFGSPAYMAPEQLLGGKVDERSDVWGLAVLAYEALTGVRPFSGASGVELTMRILTKGFAPPTRVVQTLPKPLDAWFLRALSKKPARRFASVAEAAQAFAAALRSPARDTALSARRAPARAKREWGSLRRITPAVAAAALVVANFAFGGSNDASAAPPPADVAAR